MKLSEKNLKWSGNYNWDHQIVQELEFALELERGPQTVAVFEGSA